MSKPFKPRRGKRTTAISKNVVLQKGELFFEVPATGAGTGEGKLFMGDGTTAYENLPSFLDNSGKVDKVANPTTGALTALDASGNITDTGIKFDVTSPTTGQSLIYDATTNTWVNGENFPTPTEITYEAFLLLPEAQKETGNYLVTDWPGVNMTEDMAALRRDVNALSNNKADKVSGATAGDLAKLDGNGNLADSGVKLLISSPSAGQALLYDTTNQVWANGSLPSPEGKADKVSGATAGDLAGLDNNGNLTDSGIKISISSPTSGDALIYDATNSVWSNIPIPSPDGKADKVSGATNGDLAGLDANGNLTDTGVKSANLVTADGTTHVLSGILIANATETANLGVKQVRNIYCGTTDLTPGVSVLPAGDIYIYYEET